MKKLILIIIALFFIACSNSNNYFNSTLNLNNNIQQEVIINDIADIVKNNYIKQSTLYLSTSDANKDFFNHLCDILRNEGFAISDDNSLKGLNFISYSISQIDENIFVTINIDANKVNITYKVKDNKIFKNSISFFDY
ncbi:hypothetical protein AVBRAN12640_07870 [Campylobacter sp. RM12640]|uniref:hypothetical protein n=1 Tax=unclassified Campylobacter TaxID=2593542 RepID=UPI001D99D391|nr:hypothetical protein [Campylobacter sp. RM12642]MBZ7982451.1 hypothetical protein [Campylobacter sp. RM12640]MBZ7989956.1 hypothetical protein [Campylobacter sp. RM12635]MBZ8008231.1 hypothetical protein [Campylobacter sp. RM9334]